MLAAVETVRDLVASIRPFDALETQHRQETLDWLARTDDVFRRRKPTTPPQHLVSYVVPLDPDSGKVLLIDHINAKLWLPPGGHVEPGEHPAHAARRELDEELGVHQPVPPGPGFVTVTETVGQAAGHVDVSLWFGVVLHQSEPLRLAAAEMSGARWWSLAEISADPAAFDPHLGRYIAKTNSYQPSR